MGSGAPVLVSTFATTAVLGVGCPGSSHPSPSRKTTDAPSNSPWTTQVNLGIADVPPTMALVQLLGRLPPAACMTVVSALRVPATLVLPVRHASAMLPHAVKVESRASPAGSLSPVRRLARAAAWSLALPRPCPVDLL
jgi:hypothetical protein